MDFAAGILTLVWFETSSINKEATHSVAAGLGSSASTHGSGDDDNASQSQIGGDAE
jgi:hypothetical protein